MAALETLTILMEADRSQLQSQLLAAGKNIQEFTVKMSKNKVDWKKIMTEGLTSTAVAMIAATLATAITQSLKFQYNMQQTMAAAGQSAATNGQAISKSVLDVSNNTVQSSESVASAMSLAIKSLGDYGLAQMVVQKAGMEATATGQDFMTVTQGFINVLKSYGITSMDEASKALDAFANAQVKSALSFSEFTNAIVSNAAQLRGRVDFTDAVNTLAAFSKQAGVTASDAVADFGTVAEAVGHANLPLDTFLGGVDKIDKIVKEKGMVGVFEAIGGELKKWPVEYAVVLASRLGVAAQNAITLRNQDFSKLSKDLVDIGTNVQTINDRFDSSGSVIRDLQDAWNKFLNSFTNTKEINTFFTVLTGSLNELESNISKSGSLIGGIFQSLKDNAEASFGKGGESWGEAFDKAAASQATAAGVQGTVATNIIKKLQGSGLGFNSGALENIVTAGQNKNLLPELLSALSGNSLGGSQATNFYNTFHITAPSGGEQLTAQSIIQQLYKAFNYSTK